LIVGDDLKNHNFNSVKNKYTYNFHVKYFEDIFMNSTILNLQQQLDRPSHWFQKKFQFHKFHLFDEYFKQYNYILYLDCGIIIQRSIQPILDERKPNCFFANRDGIDLELGTGLLLKHQFVHCEPYYS
jgi:hypothetical protein